jgi:ribosomal protein L40E
MKKVCRDCDAVNESYRVYCKKCSSELYFNHEEKELKKVLV